MNVKDEYEYLTTFFTSIRSRPLYEKDLVKIQNRSINEMDNNIDESEVLVVTGAIPEQTLLTAYTFKYNDWDKLDIVMTTCEKIYNIFETFTCDYSNALERYKLSARAFDFFSWMLDGIRYSLVSLDPLIPGIEACIKTLIETMKKFIKNSFFHLLIYTYIHHNQKEVNPNELLSQAEIIIQAKEKLSLIDKNEALENLIQEVSKLVQTVIDGPRARVIRPNHCVTAEKHPGVLTLGTIFSCFNVIESDMEVAQTVLMFSHTVGITRTEMLFDFIRVGPLIQLKELDVAKRSLVDVFTYLRTPNIIKLFVQKLDIKKECLIAALRKFVILRSLLNAVDKRTSTHSVKHLLNSLTKLSLITAEEGVELLNIRNAEIALKPQLGFLLSETSLPESCLEKINTAEQVTLIIRKAMAHENEKFLAIVERVMLKTDGTMERACAVMCASNELRNFALRLSKINQDCESPNGEWNAPDSRMHAFSVTFLLLVRIKYVFRDLRITLTAPELEQSMFFSWWNVYETGLICKTTMTTSCENKEIFLTQYNILKQSKPFWNDTDEVSSIIDNIPGIAELIVEDYRRGWPGIELAIEHCLTAFHFLPCIFVCFMQWLETETPTENIRDFSRKIYSILQKSLPSASKAWCFAVYAVDPAITHLINRTLDGPHYSFVITSARRILPKLFFLQAPEEIDLKDAFVIASHEGWAAPDCIDICSNSIHTLSYRKLVLTWLRQMTKSICADELIAAGELILAVAFLKPVAMFAELTQKLMDMVFVLPGTALSQICYRSFAWLIVRIKTLLIYAEQVRREKESYKKSLKPRSDGEKVTEPPAKMRRVDEMEVEEPPSTKAKDEEVVEFEKEQSILIFDDDKGPEVKEDFELDEEPLPAGDEWPLPKNVHKIDEEAFIYLTSINQHPISMPLHSINLSIRRIEKQIKLPLLRANMTFIVHLFRELVRVPRSRFWYKLACIIFKPKSFQSLARIEPFALPLDEALRLYDIRDPQQLEHLLYYACLLRRLGAE